MDANRNLKIYTPKRLSQHSDDVEKFVIGRQRPEAAPRKGILVMGATGTGKTTFINAMANYLYEVDVSDEFRLKIVTEEDEGAERASSATTKVTAYEFHGTRLPFVVTVVDTPGFGDTKGLEADKKTTAQIKKLFDGGHAVGIQALDAICLVVKSTDTRLSAQMRYNFMSVFKHFGKDLAGNLLITATFADGMDEQPPVLRCLEESAISYRLFHTFNNKHFFHVRYTRN